MNQAKTNNPINLESILPMLQCPISQTELSVADPELIASINEKIAKKEQVNNIGQTVEDPIESGLVNADRSTLLPIRDGIIVLVIDQAIPLKQ